MRIALVYRSRGDFELKHVHRLVKQIREVGKLDNDVLLFTNAVDEGCDSYKTVTLMHSETGWWSKMALYRAGVGGDLLYFDLDSTILGPLTDIANVGQLAILRGNTRTDRGRPFYSGYQSALMYLTEEARTHAWAEWSAQGGMRCTAKYLGGDDRFLETVPYWRQHARFFQDLVPEQIQHYKKDIRKRHGGVVPAGTRLVAFCKNPRPWDIPELGIAS